MPTIYIVDNELDLLTLTQKYLEKEGYCVETFTTGESALNALNNPVDLWLLDIMLDGEISGYDLIKEINKQNPTPTIFMSARNQEIDRIMGLELGSDDYITKPFSMREMVLRVNNVLRRTGNTKPATFKTYGDYTVHLDSRTVEQNAETLPLTSKETDLVILLLDNINQSFTREQLITHIWGNDYFGSDRVVDDLVKRVRKKMINFNIETIYGYGYRLNP